MKDVYYDGSLKDDLELINNNDEIITKLYKKEKRITVIFLLLVGAAAALAYKAKQILSFWMIYFGINGFYSSGMDDIKEEKAKRKKKRKQAKLKVKEFIDVLNPELNENDEKKCHVTDGYVTYDNLKQAVIITKEEIVPVEEDYEYFLYDYGEKDFDEYVKVITSDMYFLDTRNKIRALRETKKIIKHSSKYPEVKETKLELFEDKDFPNPLPVEKKLELRDNYFM